MVIAPQETLPEAENGEEESGELHDCEKLVS
jgi:hypothetical protein